MSSVKVLMASTILAAGDGRFATASEHIRWVPEEEGPAKRTERKGHKCKKQKI